MPLQAKNPVQALRSRDEDVVYTQANTIANPTSLPELSREAMRKMLHELQVHQIELEMQNEELRQTRGELDAARARYFDLYDLAPVGYCTVAENGLVLEVNFTAAAMLDVVRGDLIHKPASHLIARADQDIYYQCRNTLFETGAAQDCELQMIKRSGAAFWVHMRVTAAQDSRGAQVHGMVLSDISERKRLNDALRAKNRERQTAREVADKANRAKTDVLSKMSHELRPSLNATLGFAQLMEMAKPAPSPTQTNNIQHIPRAGWYLLDLIGEMLDLTSIESGRLKLALETVPVLEVLQASRDNVAATAQQAGIEIHLGQVNAALQVYADRACLQQVMAHLLSNASKYNSNGGYVEITCGVDPDWRLRICEHDTGYGLSTDKITDLFQPFTRSGRETSAEEGTGAGLTLSKRLVEPMDSTIGAHSTVGVGSVF